MDILFVLIPLSVVLAVAIGACVWYAVGSGQFDDLDGPALDVVADDDAPVPFDPGQARARRGPYHGAHRD